MALSGQDARGSSLGQVMYAGWGGSNTCEIERMRRARASQSSTITDVGFTTRMSSLTSSALLRDTCAVPTRNIYGSNRQIEGTGRHMQALKLYALQRVSCSCWRAAANLACRGHLCTVAEVPQQRGRL